MVNLIKASKFSDFNQIIADDNISTSAAIFYYNGAFDIARTEMFGTFRGALYYGM